MSGNVLINEGRRANDSQRVIAGCALQTRGLALLPVVDLEPEPPLVKRWATVGLRETREQLGDEAARAGGR